MQKNRFTEEPIICFLKQVEAGLPINKLYRNGGFAGYSDGLGRRRGGRLRLDFWLWFGLRAGVGLGGAERWAFHRGASCADVAREVVTLCRRHGSCGF